MQGHGKLLCGDSRPIGESLAHTGGIVLIAQVIAKAPVAEHLRCVRQQLQVGFRGLLRTKRTSSSETGLPSGDSKGMGKLRRMKAPRG